MEYKPNFNKYEKLELGLETEVSEEVLTPEMMIKEYPKLDKPKNDWGKFSNWNNWPHSR